MNRTFIVLCIISLFNLNVFAQERMNLKDRNLREAMNEISYMNNVELTLNFSQFDEMCDYLTSAKNISSIYFETTEADKSFTSLFRGKNIIAIFASNKNLKMYLDNELITRENLYDIIRRKIQSENMRNLENKQTNSAAGASVRNRPMK